MKKNHLPLNLRHLLTVKNMSQSSLESKINKNRGTIGSYISKKASPNIETLQKLSDVLQISIDALINNDLTVTSFNKISKEKNEESTNLTVEDIIADKVLKKLQPYLDKIELQDAVLAKVLLEVGKAKENTSR